MILHRRGGRNSLHRYSSIVAFPPSLLRMVFRFRVSGISSSPLSGIRFPESRDGGLGGDFAWAAKCRLLIDCETARGFPWDSPIGPEKNKLMQPCSPLRRRRRPFAATVLYFTDALLSSVSHRYLLFETWLLANHAWILPRWHSWRLGAGTWLSR